MSNINFGQETQSVGWPTESPEPGYEWYQVGYKEFKQRQTQSARQAEYITSINIYTAPDRADIRGGIERRLKAHIGTNDKPETLEMMLTSTKKFLRDRQTRATQTPELNRARVDSLTMQIEEIEKMMGIGGFDMKILLIPAAVIGGLMLLG